jgi:cytochrome P450
MTEKLADLDDLFADDAIRNPYAFFGRIRETDPVHWNARHQLWIITRHADVVSIVRDHESFSSAVIKSDSRPPYPPLDENGLTLLDEVRRFRGAQLVEQDPPRHSSMRRLLHQYFTAQAIEKWRPFIRSAVVELLDEIESGATLDVMTALAAPLPVRVIAHLMDVPANDRPPTSSSTSTVESRTASLHSSKESAGFSTIRHRWPRCACESRGRTSSRYWPRASVSG